MSYRRPSTYPYPNQFKSIEDAEKYAKDMYRALLENDSRGEEITARATDKDLKELIVRPEWYGAKGNGVHDDTAAIQAANVIGGNIVLSNKTYLVDGDITISAGTTLSFVNGGNLSIAAGHVVTINGNISAGLRQIFSGLGSVVFTPGSVAVIELRWFGATGDGVTDDAPAV
jgi:polygalacturonase